MNLSFIGIDPGKSGGIAIVTSGKPAWACPMPETHKDIHDTLNALRCWSGRESICALEQVHAMPGQGVTSMFTFGMGYGALQMALTALAIPFQLVTPQRWQKELQCLTKGDKLVSLRKAQQLFPDANWGKTKKHNLAIADALLIAEWLRRQP